MAESPHWFAGPKGPTTKKTSSTAQHQEEGLLYIAGRGAYLACKELSRQGEGLFLQQGRKIAIKRPLIAHVYETLTHKGKNIHPESTSN